MGDDVSAALGPGDGPDLRRVWDEVRAAVSETGRVVFPAVPHLPECTVFWPEDAEDSWPKFLTVAGQVEAPILYVLASGLLASAETGIRVPDKRVVAQFPDRTGQLGEIVIAFAVGGVMHVWSHTADWWDAVADALDELESGPRRQDSDDYSDFDNPDWVPQWIDVRTPAGLAAVQDGLGADMLEAAIERVRVNELFLQARSGYTRRTVMVDSAGDPQLAEWWHGAAEDDPQFAVKRAAVNYVLDEAAERAERDRQERVAAALADVDRLLPQLREFPGWAQARLSGEKQRRIREFVRSYLGFPSVDLADRLYSAVRDADRNLGGRAPL